MAVDLSDSADIYYLRLSSREVLADKAGANASAKCIVVTGSLQECLRGGGV